MKKASSYASYFNKEFKDCRANGYSKTACTASSVGGIASNTFISTAGVSIAGAGITSGNMPIFALGSGIAYIASDISKNIKNNILKLFKKKEKLDTMPISNPNWTGMTMNPKNIMPITSTELKTIPENHITYNIYSWTNQYEYVNQQFQQEIIKSSFSLDISSLITCLASNLLTSMFFSNDNNPTSVILEVFQTCFMKLSEFINIVRKEMHERFDIIDEKLNLIHMDMIYFCQNIISKLELIEKNIDKNFSYSNFRLDVINNNILSLESLVGNGFREIHWITIKNQINDYVNYYDRYGIIIPTEYIIDLASIIENIILNPPCVDWLNRNYFNSKPFTKQIDDEYFDKFNRSIYYGWLCENKALPTDITNELLKVYQQLRFEFARRNIKYDNENNIYNKLKDKLKSFNKTFSKEDVIKICDEIITADDKIKEITDLKTKEYFGPYFDKAQENHIKKIDEYLIGFDHCNDIRMYINDNHDDVTGYVHSRLCLERDNFIKNMTNHEIKDFSNYKIMIRYGNCNYLAKHYSIYDEKINVSLKTQIKKDFINFIKAENLGFGRLNLEWHLTLNTPEYNYDPYYRIGSNIEIQVQKLGRLFDGRVLGCTFEIKAFWQNSVSNTCLGSYSTNNSNSLECNPDISMMIPNNYGFGFLPTSDHTIAIEATKIVGKTSGWSSLTKTNNYDAEELLIKQKNDLEMLKINNAITKDVSEQTIIYQSNLIKNKRKLYALTKNKDIYERSDFVKLLKENYKCTTLSHTWYSIAEQEVRKKLNYISGNHFKKEIKFDESFDIILHEIPEYPEPKVEVIKVSKKDRIKQIFKEITMCLERKDELEKELEKLLDE